MLLLVALTLLHGTVRIGPTMPVCKAGVPCDKPAARARLTFAHGTRRVQVTTDGLGRYRVRLAPGTWTVHANVGMAIAPLRFVVPRVASARRDFAIDTGIR
ncbi:MAG: hypothetical protein ACXVQQ_01180 [Gaiellaceae bacterium]